MTGSGSPCGACKFLRRKCVKGCVFAPYFSHEQGATHFAAIHKVFGASNVSKLLAHLPVSDRCEAAVTISYEAQARLQEPIYGCVSHIFALQQQVVNLQAELASLRAQAAQNFLNASTTVSSGKHPSFPQDLQSWFQSENSNMISHLNPNLNNTMAYGGKGFMDPTSIGNYGNLANSFDSCEEASQSLSCFDMQSDKRQWTYQDADDLRSVAFGYAQHS
ncbi:hypothetical protein K2173_026266 [Erythroxylum novogranatense]|uniref:LOB domain-containing protein n=1 Tax=Erythroxylum novogranatense TaxID=1862640 RepID=A0AAV8SBM1_9ROSI|nr:hypothetical protein K2173_026266 [Erythroxylum novogranatense]